MSYIIIISGLITILALVFFVKSLRKFLHRRPIQGLGLALAAISLLLASNLYTYQRLVYERPLADIRFTVLQPQDYKVVLRQRETGQQQLFELRGDEWQLDAQVLIWKGFASLLGLDAGYRLYRLAGRYQDIQQARNAPRTVYSLLSPHSLDTSVAGKWQLENWTLDIWTLVHKHVSQLDFVDAAFGSAVILPMTDGAKYTVFISRTGLLARPVNKQAREAVTGWMSL